MRKKLTALFLTFCLALTPFTPAFAAGGTDTAGSVTKVNSIDTLQTAIQNAKDGDVIQLAAGNYVLSDCLTIQKAVSLIGEEGTSIISTADVAIQFSFSSSKKDHPFSIENISFESGNGIQALQFRGDLPSGQKENNNYDVTATVSNCSFKNWQMGVTVNSHANGYNITVTDCTFETGRYAVSYSRDTETVGQINDNQVAFKGNNKLINVTFAAQVFNNVASTNEEYSDKSYLTVEDYTSSSNAVDGPMVVADTTKSVQEAINSVETAGKGFVYVTSGEYDERVKATGSITLIGEKDAKITSLSLQNTTADDHEAFIYNITFVGASNSFHGDVHASALYIQGINNARVENCVFELDNTKIHCTDESKKDIGYGIVTSSNTVNEITVTGTVMKGYDVAAYHNPGETVVNYENNTITTEDDENGLVFNGVTGIVTIKENTFTGDSSIVLEPSWEADQAPCKAVTVVGNSFTPSTADGAVIKTYSTGTEGETIEGINDGTLKIGTNYWGTNEGEEPDFATLIDIGDPAEGK